MRPAQERLRRGQMRREGVPYPPRSSDTASAPVSRHLPLAPGADWLRGRLNCPRGDPREPGVPPGKERGLIRVLPSGPGPPSRPPRLFLQLGRHLGRHGGQAEVLRGPNRPRPDNILGGGPLRGASEPKGSFGRAPEGRGEPREAEGAGGDHKGEGEGVPFGQGAGEP